MNTEKLRSIKKLAMASVIFLGVSSPLIYFDLSSIWTGFVVGFLAYSLSNWYFSTKVERADTVRMYRNLGGLAKENWPSVLGTAFFTVTGLLMLEHEAVPSEPAVHSLMTLVQGLGFLFLLIIPALAIIFHCAYTDEKPPLAWPYLKKLLLGAWFYLLAIRSIGEYGDQIYELVVHNQEESIILLVAVAIVWIIAKQSGVHRSPALGFERSFEAGSYAGFGQAIASSTTPSTARDRKYTAAHEAGNALVYAALGAIPPRVQVTVHEQADEKGSLGFVSALQTEHRLNDNTFAYWTMLVLLAGKIGESRIMQTPSLGSENDHIHWVRIAHLYLSNHHRGIYYPQPETALEQKHNAGMLTALQEEQLSLLDQLFEMNDQVHKDMMAALLEEGTLFSFELIPFLARVKLPKEFPLPFGPFETFSSTWTDRDIH